MGQRLTVAAAFTAVLTVVASAYGATTVGPKSYAALALVVLAIGVTAARPGRGATGIFVQDTAGGTVARWLLPATVLGRFLVGGVAVTGERAGYYGFELALALVTLANLSLFTALVWVLAVRLHRTDARRVQTEMELRRINAELEERVRARTSELAASERQYRRLIEDSTEGIMIHQLGRHPLHQRGRDARLRVRERRRGEGPAGDGTRRAGVPRDERGPGRRAPARRADVPATIEVEGLRVTGAASGWRPPAPRMNGRAARPPSSRSSTSASASAARRPSGTPRTSGR